MNQMGDWCGSKDHAIHRMESRVRRKLETEAQADSNDWFTTGNRGLISFGEVFFLLTRPLMGDPRFTPDLNLGRVGVLVLVHEDMGKGPSIAVSHISIL